MSTNGCPHSNGASQPDWPMPNLPSKCTWALGKDFSESPHKHVAKVNWHRERPKIISNVLEYIGDTPMIQLNKIKKMYGLKCELLGKCEIFNAGGSVKDRIALPMIEAAERSGKLKPGGTVIKPTSGNAGIGIALVCAVKGYKCVIVMPQRMSKEKADVLRALGAECVRTANGAPVTSPESHIAVAYRLGREIPNSLVLDQYVDATNPLAHYDTTAEEIVFQCDGKLDMCIMGTGTGGTATGVGRKLKEKIPGVKIVGVDPVGSKMALPPEVNKTNVKGFQVEGIGHGWVPTVCDQDIIDIWVKVGDKESFNMARRLIRHEGLLVGGSCGTAICAAVEAAKDLREDQRCVVILPDSVRNYMTKFLSDEWMLENGWLEEEETIPAAKQPWWWSKTVESLKLREMTTVDAQAKCKECIEVLKKGGFDQLPVKNGDGSVVGMVTLSALMAKLVKGEMKADDPVSSALLQQFRKVDPSTSLAELSKILNAIPFAVVQNGKGPVGVVTSIDFVDYITNGVH
ncbi:cystathionine beta-synthase-like [Oscarella lobularis]|uniref:cystathionine beta-synthase-like n=1 Tax=Oscarella lobularis TaxID=121494 RepID=UPI003313E9BC